MQISSLANAIGTGRNFCCRCIALCVSVRITVSVAIRVPSVALR